MNLPDRLRLLERIAEPLDFAHARGSIHRDLKPDNVMIGAFGEVLVMNWGLAEVGVTSLKPAENEIATAVQPAQTRCASPVRGASSVLRATCRPNKRAVIPRQTTAPIASRWVRSYGSC
jgi:serine/threonine protein kinase